MRAENKTTFLCLTIAEPIEFYKALESYRGTLGPIRVCIGAYRRRENPIGVSRFVQLRCHLRSHVGGRTISQKVCRYLLKSAPKMLTDGKGFIVIRVSRPISEKLVR